MTFNMVLLAIQRCPRTLTPRPNRFKIFGESQSNQWSWDHLWVSLEGFKGFRKYFQGSLGRKWPLRPPISQGEIRILLETLGDTLNPRKKFYLPKSYIKFNSFIINFFVRPTLIGVALLIQHRFAKIYKGSP